MKRCCAFTLGQIVQDYLCSFKNIYKAIDLLQGQKRKVTAEPTLSPFCPAGPGGPTAPLSPFAPGKPSGPVNPGAPIGP